jgi:hypothetical protein
MHPEDLERLHALEPASEPEVNLLSGLDSLFLLRRDIRAHLDDVDLSRQVATEKGLLEVGGLQDISNHVVVDRGRIIGIWEYDPYAQEIVPVLFVERNDAIDRAIGDTEEFIRDQLGDARSFSLDSPESRRPVIAQLRALAER